MITADMLCEVDGEALERLRQASTRPQPRFATREEAVQRFRLQPFPGVEFRMFGVDVDVAVGAHEPRQEPDLPLAAIFAAPGDRHQLGRQVVEQRILRLGDEVLSSANVSAESWRGTWRRITMRGAWALPCPTCSSPW